MKKALILALLLLLIPMNNTIATSNPSTNLDAFNVYMDKALQLAKTQQYEEAFHVVSYLDKQLVDQTMNYPLADKNFISILFSEINRLSDDPVSYHDEIIHQLTKARLYTDSLNDSNKPLWKNYDKLVFLTLDQLKESAGNKNSETYQKEVNTLIKVYDLLSPSMVKQVEMERINKLDSSIQQLDINRNQLLLTDELEEALEVIQADLQYVFYGLETDEADPSLWWVIFTTGSIIISTLSYVGFRKYKAEEQSKKEPERFKNK